MAGRPRTTDWNSILSACQEGLCASHIAKLRGISVAQVHRVAKLHGISVAPPEKYKNPLWDKIVARVLETQNGYLVDKEFGLSPGSAKRICRNLGIEYPARIGKMKENLSQDEIFLKHPEWSDIYSMYLSGMSQIEIADTVGLSQPSVGYVLSKLGASLGKGAKSKRQRKFLPDNLAELYNSGMSCKEIGDTYGVKSEVVRRRLRQLQVPRRIGKASGEKNPQWKGGRNPTTHYYRRQAYEIAAICLGKPLPRGHIIHHIDENPQNNSPRNLMIFESDALHARYHQTALKSRLQVGSEEAILLALEIGGVPLPEPKIPIEL